MVKFRKIVIKENWNQSEIIYTFLSNIFLRHPDDAGEKKEWIADMVWPNNIFHVGEQWMIYWPWTDETNGFICLIRNNEKRMVIKEDLDNNISQGNIKIKIIEDSKSNKIF